MRQPDQGQQSLSGNRKPAGWGRVLRGSPATLIFVVLFWTAGLVSGSVRTGPPPFLLPHVAATSHSMPDHWWALLLSAFWERDLAGYLVGTLAVMLAGLPLERRLGSLRFTVAGLFGQLLGILATLGFLAAARGLMGSWIRDLSGHFFLGPSALACAAAMAATAALSTLWRRRIRVVLLAVLLLFAMYAGGFEDLVRLGAAAAGGLLGPVLQGRRPRFGRPAVSRHEARILVALLLTVAAVGPVVAGLAPHAVGPLSVLKYLFTNIQPVDPAALQASCSRPADLRDCAAAQLQLRAGAGGIFMAILPSFLLLLLADGLRRGRRFAWAGALLIQASLSLLAAVTIAGVLLPPPGTASSDREGVGGIELSGYSHPLSLVLPMLLPVLLTLLLLAGRNLFPVRAPRGTYLRLARRVAVALVLLSLVYVGLGLLLASGFTPAPGLLQLLADVPDRFLPLGFLVDRSPAFFPESTAAVVLYESIGVVFWAWTGALLLRTFLRPAHGRHSADEERARRILKAHGGGSLSWMTTWSGNSYWFSGPSFIAYRVLNGVAVALGPPVGPAAGREAAFTEFARHCRLSGWTPCFYFVPESLRALGTSLGWGSVQVAQETVLRLDEVSFRGKKFQDIRTALNRAGKAGVRAEWTTFAQAPIAVQAQIEAISEEWVADKKVPEMGFTLGSLDELDDPEVRCLLAIDADHTVHAVASWLPVYRNGYVVGWTLDFMRRRGDGFRASIDFLIASAALSLQDEGCEFMSLSGAPLARVPSVSPPAGGVAGSFGGEGGAPAGAGGAPAGAPGAADASGALDRMLDWLGAALEPVYGFRSLLAFKAKFKPDYVPMYLLYPDAAALPAIANAITRAYLPSINLGQGLTLVRGLLTRR
ncbi:bifunctional lysylphosphatidylglycerol flippase/synthetase MprF [Arthrobacter sp. NPDC056727]|uniref:bifunctional lysylphosphatidylglycerol flippase/synthetase MprF n=1 Tax=Arthrobacter sp. NPDC056727 TaxID=3345927 RepID=UPI003672ACC3